MLQNYNLNRYKLVNKNCISPLIFAIKIPNMKFSNDLICRLNQLNLMILSLIDSGYDSMFINEWILNVKLKFYI